MESPAFADLLRYHRVAAGLSQEALAMRSGLSLQAVSHLERGIRRGPRRETVALLAAAMGLSATQTATLEGASHRRRSPRPAPPPPPPGLPHGASPILGRETDLAVLPFMLRQPDVRLLTLIGPAGVGKTRLAVEVTVLAAPTFTDGITWVDLAPIHDAGLAPSTIALRLGLRVEDAAYAERLTAHLRSRDTLLVLDNLEQVLPVVALIQDLLDTCPRLRILATSRVALGTRQERQYAVTPLALPPPNQDDPTIVGEYAAVAMFLARARAVVPDLALTAVTAPVVAAVCRRLDGLPLAIELAAALARLVPPQAMLARLGEAASGAPAQQGAQDSDPGRTPPSSRTLDLLASGGWDRPDRQQTMRQAIAWSYELLTPPEQVVFRALGVFVGGWTIAAATAVVGDDLPADQLTGLLEALSAKHLVRTVENQEGEPRFGMLETLREYAGECLEADEREAFEARNRHLHWCVGLAEEAEPLLIGPEQAAWPARLEREHDNLRAALAWGTTERGDGAAGLRVAGALWRFWHIRGHLSEGSAWLDRTLARGQGTTAERAKALNGAGNLAFYQGDYERSGALHEESLALRRRLADQQGIAMSLNNLGNLAAIQGNYGRATALFEESVAIDRGLGNIQGLANSLNNLGNLAAIQGDNAQAEAWFEETLAMERELGNRQGLANSLNNLGTLANLQGNYERAVALHTEGLAVMRALGDRWGVAKSVSSLGSVTRKQGEYGQATTLFEESLKLFRDMGEQTMVVECIEGLALTALGREELPRAAQLLAAAACRREALGAPLPPMDRIVYEEAVQRVRLELGEEVFLATEAIGRALSLEEVIALALSPTAREAAAEEPE
jgi:predicted ATPase/transcriptional regulator with XRE-family HTH domain